MRCFSNFKVFCKKKKEGSMPFQFGFDVFFIFYGVCMLKIWIVVRTSLTFAVMVRENYKRVNGEVFLCLGV